ncbi:hypothetical protein GCM10027416_14020 [Okibacterium endophyticum]
MPRSNRSRRRKPVDDEGDLSHLLSGWKRTEQRRGREWFVQPVSAARAVKDYVCPGCSGTILQGTAHMVIWRADGVLGDAADLESRRHWHSHCWRAW